MTLTERIHDILQDRLGQDLERYRFPPPVFLTMEGKFLSLDLQRGVLETEFPVLERYLNPYHMLQGGILGAAVDNTLGPLSVLVAPPSVTRHLKMTYSLPVDLGMGFFKVIGKYQKKEGRRLYFTAEIRGPGGDRLARAKAVHYLVDQYQ